MDPLFFFKEKIITFWTYPSYFNIKGIILCLFNAVSMPI